MIDKSLIFLMLVGVDLISTYLFFYSHKKIFPRKKNVDLMERNDLIRFFWRKYGLHKGTIFNLIAVSPIIFIVMYIIHTTIEFFYVVVGMYSMLFLVHYHNIMDLRQAKKEKDEKRNTAREKRKRNKRYPYKKKGGKK